MKETRISYTSNYFKIYAWKFISYIAAFGSVAVVTPRITSSPGLFGIFSFCMSLNIFFQYADLGFLNAAQKYASEYYARLDLDGEIKVTGFSCFILSLFIIPIGAVILWFAFHPTSIIKGLNSPAELRLASGLFWALFVFSPLVIVQRMIQIIFSVRLEDYLPQRINIVISIVRILSVFYFFGNGRYMLLEYFVFYNGLTLVSLSVIIGIAKRRYGYSFASLLRSFRFSTELYRKTAKLAYNSLFLSLSWIVFYELDLVYIGYFIGKDGVAFYALGATVLAFVRDVYGSFYYPFVVRFNHFVGVKDEGAMKNMYHTLLKVGGAVCIIPMVSLIILMKPLMLSWVGGTYARSIAIGQLLVASSLFGFITYPAGALLTAQERLNELYINSIVLPVIFCIGVVSTQHWLGIDSYAIFKTVAIFVSAGILLSFTLKQFQIPMKRFFTQYIGTLLIPTVFVLVVGYGIQHFLLVHKGITYFLISGSLVGVLTIIGFVIYYFIDPFFREFSLQTVNKLLKRDKLIT